MPCNTVVASKVEFLAQSTDLKMLGDALVAMGLYVSAASENHVSFYVDGQSAMFDKRTGRLETPQGFDTAALKRAYSKQIVTTQAKKNGWKLSWATDEKTGNEVATVERNY